jgi:hypothetical protein
MSNGLLQISADTVAREPGTDRAAGTRIPGSSPASVEQHAAQVEPTQNAVGSLRVDAGLPEETILTAAWFGS